jgi:hypothetical protein
LFFLNSSDLHLSLRFPILMGVLRFLCRAGRDKEQKRKADRAAARVQRQLAAGPSGPRRQNRLKNMRAEQRAAARAGTTGNGTAGKKKGEKKGKKKGKGHRP